MIYCLLQVSFICESPGTTTTPEEAWIQSEFSFDVKLVKPSLQDNNTHRKEGRKKKERKGKKKHSHHQQSIQVCWSMTTYVLPPTQKEQIGSEVSLDM
jgi:hypothetical protein